MRLSSDPRMPRHRLNRAATASPLRTRQRLRRTRSKIARCGHHRSAPAVQTLSFHLPRKNELPSAELPSEDDALKLLRHHEKRSRKYSEFLVRQTKGETTILRALALEKYLVGPRDVWVSDHISLHGQSKTLEIVRDVLPIMRQRGDKDTIESRLASVSHSLCDRMSQYRIGLDDMVLRGVPWIDFYRF